jgi:4-amino-4-deoxy-L-arabinose transferase-like glycosyltransferase
MPPRSALIFVLGQRLLDSTAGIAAATSYALLSVSPSVGLAAHATHFVMLPVVGGILLMLKRSEPERHALGQFFVSGLLFSIGALMKQPAFFFVPFGAIYLLWNALHRRLVLKIVLLRFFMFGIGAIVPTNRMSHSLACRRAR